MLGRHAGALRPSPFYKARTHKRRPRPRPRPLLPLLPAAAAHLSPAAAPAAPSPPHPPPPPPPPTCRRRRRRRRHRPRRSFTCPPYPRVQAARVLPLFVVHFAIHRRSAPVPAGARCSNGSCIVNNAGSLHSSWLTVALNALSSVAGRRQLPPHSEWGWEVGS